MSENTSKESTQKPIVLNSGVEKFLKELHLEKYNEEFAKNEIDEESLLELDENDLKEMKIAIGPRKKILAKIRQMKEGTIATPQVLPKRERVVHVEPTEQVHTFGDSNTIKQGGVKVVILIGGPSKGTRFRPLGRKPLFPVAGRPFIWHHLKACSKLADLSEVLLMGFYEMDQEWVEFITSAQEELHVPIRYLRELTRMGTAGGLSKFRQYVLEGNPQYIFLLHCDISCSFPLEEVLNFHKQHGKEITILGKKVPEKEAKKYGCLAIDNTTMEALHYAEKPETFVSDTINCGVYCFSPSVYKLIDQVMKQHKDPDTDPGYLQIEQDLLMKYCGDGKVYVFETRDFWMQVKSAGTVVKCSELLMEQMKGKGADVFAKPSANGPAILGNVIIHPTAKVHPTAKLGPNVTIGSGAVIGAGVRIQHAIILDGAEIKARSCVLHSVIGWSCSIGQWTRIEGTPDIPTSCGITILEYTNTT